MPRLLPLFLLAALVGPLAAQDVSVPYTEFTLANGLRVLVHEDHSTPLVTLNTYYGVGGIHEKPGRTGFAHLFEHVMFEGSTRVEEGDFDRLLLAAGGTSNATTGFDWTYYYETVPSNALELALWLEADRLGGLLDDMHQGKLDGQREVVKNERRQRYENQPYGLFLEQMFSTLYPAGSPYSWLPIGSMADLGAASLEDVKQFFRTYYVPNNATLVIAGDVTPAQVRPLVEKHFGWIPRGADVPKLDPRIPPLAGTRHLVREDKVTLPQVNLAWRTAPLFSDDHWALNALAYLLAEGKNSRLYRRLVYDERTAQQVSAFQNGQLLSGDFFVRVTARPDGDLGALERAVLEEVAKLASEGPTAEEVQRVVNGLETEFVLSISTVEGKAEQLNSYLYYTGRPDYLVEDLRRVRALAPADVQRAAQRYLHGRHRVVLSFVPQGKTALAATSQENAR
ncbi:MAG TPA: pitrilysin family protein [Gemmatimonadales bacterium]|nr:pitrilysin family protein [Gemmatimonadales bacterium]